MVQTAKVLIVTVLFFLAEAFNIYEYTHYFDYLPYRQEGLAGFEVLFVIIYPTDLL